MSAYHNPNDRRAGTAAFTLVELAVVVAMMGILSAILLPALGTAKERSKRAVCKSYVRQDLQIFQMYADDNRQFLPSSIDNLGYYHSICFSDETYSNLASAAGNTNIFYCPNMIFNGTKPTHTASGYTIGYSYLAANIQSTVKGPDPTWIPPQKWTDPPSTPLIADANYWTDDPTQTIIAPHAKAGPVIDPATGTTITQGLAGTNSASLGAVGGNVGYLNGAVLWKAISGMSTYNASSTPEAFANW